MGRFGEYGSEVVGSVESVREVLSWRPPEEGSRAKHVQYNAVYDKFLNASSQLDHFLETFYVSVYFGGIAYDALLKPRFVNNPFM